LKAFPTRTAPRQRRMPRARPVEAVILAIATAKIPMAS
jgi:hypothetical protein